MDHGVLYLEAHLFCMIFVATLFLLNVKHWRPRVINSLSLIYILTFVSSLLDSTWILLDGKPEYILLNHIVNIVYMSLFGFSGFFWLNHCASIFSLPLWKTKFGRFLYMIPAILTAVLIAASARTGWVYTIDASGTYHRGPLFFLQLVGYGYLVVASILALKAKKQAEFTIEKKKLTTIATFALPPLLLGSVQLFFPPGSLPTTQIAILLSMVLHFTNFLESSVTQDPLTGLSNRYVLDRVIFNKINNRKHNSTSLYVLIGDLDRFKSINDTYGHLEGDRALRIVADILKKVFHNTSAILTRMGGDEFTIVIETDHVEFINQAIGQITKELEFASKHEPFQLRMSIGVAKYEDGMTMVELLKKSDADLYTQKRKRAQMLTL